MPYKEINSAKNRSNTHQNNNRLILKSTKSKPQKQPTSQLNSKGNQSSNKNILLSQSNKLDSYLGNSYTRSSGRITSVSPNNQKKNIFSQVQTIQNSVKQNIKSLNYRQRLSNIEALVKNCKQLCLQYGYFYITYAMLFYDPSAQTKLSVWIHPDIRVTKCLHPIAKNTQYEKQVQFVLNLKQILKQFFPTIFLGNGRTFTSLLIHINELKIPLFTKIIKQKEQYQKEGFKKTKSERKISPTKQGRLKQILAKKYMIPQKTITQQVQYQDQFQTKKSILRQKKNIKPFKKDKVIQPKKLTSFTNNHIKSLKYLNSIQKVQKKLDNITKLIYQQQKKLLYNSTSREINQTQIQDDLNNLFKSTNLQNGFYQKERVSQQSNQRSLIQRVVDQFEQIY